MDIDLVMICKRTRPSAGLLCLLWTMGSSNVSAFSGREGASFLDIPVGAGPAALGSAYTAAATDAYAPTWNPGGLGFLNSTQFAGMHLSYIESIAYEYASFVHPLSQGHALGAAIQYFKPGPLLGTDINGNPIGDIGGYYAAGSLSYGQRITEGFALGMTGKLIQGQIDDVSARGFGFDLGSMYQPWDPLTLGFVVGNLGSKLTFINQGDPLPLAFRLGANYAPNPTWRFLGELVYRQIAGLTSVHSGLEWRPVDILSLRAGHRTDMLNELASVSGGLTVGVAVHVWGQELAYAWVPFADFGESEYFSLIIRFGNAKRNLMPVNKEKPAMMQTGAIAEPDTSNLADFLNEQNKTLLKKSNASNESDRPR